MLVVTGANGFLGSHVVCVLLQKGFRVKALKRSGADMSEFNDIAASKFGDDLVRLQQQLSWAEAELTDIQSLDEAFAGAEYVFHCAAVISFNRAYEQMLKVNADGTANVVNACLKAGVKKLVYASSTAALGRTDDQQMINEEKMWSEDDNNTEYARTKHLAELEVWRGMEEGLNAVIVNPGIILGTGKWDKGSCRLFDNVYKGFRFYTKGVNGFVGADDVARAMLELAQSEIRGERFLLIAENLGYNEVFNTMARYFDKPAPRFEITKAHVIWLKWMAKLYSFLYPKSSITAETLSTSVKEHRYDNKKIREAIGFKFTPIEEVIRTTCMEYKK